MPTELSPFEFVRSLYNQLDLPIALHPDAAPLLPESDPVHCFQGFDLRKGAFPGENPFMGLSCLRQGQSTRLVARVKGEGLGPQKTKLLEATLDEATGRVTLRKAVERGSAIVAQTTRGVTLAELAGGNVVDKMVAGVLMAGDIGFDHAELRWTANSFRPFRAVGFGSYGTACWLCVASASVLFGVFAFRRVTQAVKG